MVKLASVPTTSPSEPGIGHNQPPPEQKSLADLEKAWKKAKNDVLVAAAVLVKIEKLALEHPDAIEAIGDKIEGTVRAGNFKFTLKETRKWDDKGLAKVEDSIDPKLKPLIWPFEITYKEGRTATRKLEAATDEASVALWKEIEACLTTKPAKTSVTVEAPKED